MWLVLNGIIELNWNQLSNLSVSDWQGNTLYLPFTPGLCITFSVISIVKAITEFNVSRIHVSPKSWKTFCQSIPIYLDFLPFFATGAFFRIASLIVIMTYISTFGFISMVGMLISSIVINQIIFRGEMEHIPNWLIVFMSLFVPVCFSTSKTSSQKLIKIQLKTFFFQTLMSFIIYGGTMIALMIYVNGESEALNLEMNPEIIIDNQQESLDL